MSVRHPSTGEWVRAVAQCRWTLTDQEAHWGQFFLQRLCWVRQWDGTLITLAAAPAKHKEDYWTRNSVYICSHFSFDLWQSTLSNRHMYSDCFKSSLFYSNWPSLFSEGEYILADSGYTSLENRVPTLKRFHLNPLTPAQSHFNNAPAKRRVASEHWNGMLKGRFGSLKEMRLVISDDKSAEHDVPGSPFVLRCTTSQLLRGWSEVWSWMIMTMWYTKSSLLNKQRGLMRWIPCKPKGGLRFFLNLFYKTDPELGSATKSSNLCYNFLFVCFYVYVSLQWASSGLVLEYLIFNSPRASP